jgi:hypothetical protein
MEEQKVFMKKDPPPGEEEVADVLGSNYELLNSIRDHVFETLGETMEEWKYYGAKNGWTLKNLYKKRNLYFIGIYPGYFRIVFVFGDRAVEKVASANISPVLKEELANTKKYAEGRGLNIKVDCPEILNDIRQLIRIKIEN